MLKISTVFWKNKFSCFFYKTLVLLTCIIVLSGCSNPVEKSEIEKQVSLLLDQMESSAIDLEHIMDEIAGLKRINTKERIKEANSVLKRGRGVLKRSEKDVYEYNSANFKHLRFIHSYLKENPDIVKHFEPEYKAMKKELGWL